MSKRVWKPPGSPLARSKVGSKIEHKELFAEAFAINLQLIFGLSSWDFKIWLGTVINIIITVC